MNASMRAASVRLSDDEATRVEVYKSLCKSQQEALQAYERTIEEIKWLCDGREDIDDNGGPNFAMQIMQAVRGERP